MRWGASGSRVDVCGMASNVIELCAWSHRPTRPIACSMRRCRRTDAKILAARFLIASSIAASLCVSSQRTTGVVGVRADGQPSCRGIPLRPLDRALLNFGIVKRQGSSWIPGGCILPPALAVQSAIVGISPPPPECMLPEDCEDTDDGQHPQPDRRREMFPDRPRPALAPGGDLSTLHVRADHQAGP